MLRPISPPTAWQAIAAFAGLFTLFSAHADPVDLWRITVLSHQGEPLKAVATLESLPEERITQECLALGSEADAPGSDAPLLKQANLKLNAARNAVEISTDAPVSSPSLELVLRVQCPGTFLYARHFSTLIPPASAAITGAVIHDGFRLKVGSGETVNSLAAAVAPGNRKLQKRLAHEIIAANPQVFPAGKSVPIPAGTVLWFPELRGVAKASATTAPAPPVAPVAKPVQRLAAVSKGAQAVPQPAPAPAIPAPKPRRPKPAAPSVAGEPIKLRQALDLGEKPGPQECRMLLPLCGVLDQGGTPAVSPATEHRASDLESGMQALKLRQDSIDSQLSRLEQSLQELRNVVESRPAVAATAPAAAPVPPPKPEIRTVVKTEYKPGPIPWYFWAGILAAALAAAAGGFLYGRRRAYNESLADSDDRLDEMLASAADEMRDLDRVPTPQPRMPRLAPVAPPPSVRDTVVNDVNGGATRKPEVPELAFDKTQVMEVAANVDPKLESGPREAKADESAPGVSSDLAFEMDQALDNTRSMFTDVDRFIALGRTQNALSLLQFQVVKDPKDRDSWIKLLAIYRQEKMDVELEKALRDFRKNFPNDKAAV